MAPKDARQTVRSVGAGECSLTGKVGFVSRADARRVVKRERHVLGRMRAYLCDGCGWWHVGHLPRAVVRGSRELEPRQLDV